MLYYIPRRSNPSLTISSNSSGCGGLAGGIRPGPQNL